MSLNALRRVVHAPHYSLASHFSRPSPTNYLQIGAYRRAASSTSVTPAQTPQIVPTQDEIDNDVQLAGLGYPQLPAISRQLRPSKGWWDQQERINHNEVLAESDDVLSMWAPDVHKMPASRAFAMLALASGVIAAFCGFFILLTPTIPAAKRIYPYDGLVKELSGTDDQKFAAVGKGQDVSTEEEEEDA
ncbi:MAG: hypothetical protein CYPHOPRED_004618 [Cyphobasidiales sp. Tagirdzhanova-0007]|nr:MAG: hypothetical protein CYPHOPRED_004618 [Cyphobasidiales sp. Tagirdzhanova-0007]